jgi:hypothetical protein
MEAALEQAIKRAKRINMFLTGTVLAELVIFIIFI